MLNKKANKFYNIQYDTLLITAVGTADVFLQPATH